MSIPRNQHSMIRRLALISIFACNFSCAMAQEVIPDFYKGPGIDDIDVTSAKASMSKSIHLMDRCNCITLISTFRETGASISKSFALKIVPRLRNRIPALFFGSAGIGWTVHFGRVLFKSTVGACGGSLWPDVLRNPVLELPDGSTQILAVSSIPGASLVSTRRWRAECTSGMTVYSPDGVRYDMERAVGVPNGTSSPSGAFYTTKITDRNGNFANITYEKSGSPEIATVTTSDGRRVEFSYLPLAGNESTRKIGTISSKDSAGNHTFTYEYSAVGDSFDGYQLKAVGRPDGTKWQYRYLGNLNAITPGGFQLNGVTYPEGGTTTYGYGTSSSDYVYFDSASNVQSRTTVVKTKATSDGGNWTFAYSPGSSGSYDTTVVDTPSGAITYRHVGPNYATSGSVWMVGLLMQKQIGNVQTETYGWTPQVISTQQLKRPGAWVATRLDGNTSAPLLSSKIVVRDGATHKTDFDGFDAYGNPSIVKENGPNGGTRITTLSYFQNVEIWLVKQIQNENVAGGIQIARTFDDYGNLLSLVENGCHVYLSLSY